MTTPETKELVLDARGWSKPDDLYDAFFRAVGAPDWHGRNFNALRDSIATGGINKVEAPYVVRIRHAGEIGAGARKTADDFVALLRELRADGAAVDVRVEP